MELFRDKKVYLKMNIAEVNVIYSTQPCVVCVFHIQVHTSNKFITVEIMIFVHVLMTAKTTKLQSFVSNLYTNQWLN